MGPLGGQVAQMKMGPLRQTPPPTPAPGSLHSWANGESVPIIIALYASEFQHGLDEFIFLKTESLIFRHNDHFKCNDHYNNPLHLLYSL